jgi:hypothetical protein
MDGIQEPFRLLGHLSERIIPREIGYPDDLAWPRYLLMSNSEWLISFLYMAMAWKGVVIMSKVCLFPTRSVNSPEKNGKYTLGGSEVGGDFDSVYVSAAAWLTHHCAIGPAGSMRCMNYPH